MSGRTRVILHAQSRSSEGQQELCLHGYLGELRVDPLREGFFLYGIMFIWKTTDTGEEREKR